MKKFSKTVIYHMLALETKRIRVIKLHNLKGNGHLYIIKFMTSNEKMLGSLGQHVYPYLIEPSNFSQVESLSLMTQDHEVPVSVI